MKHDSIHRNFVDRRNSHRPVQGNLFPEMAAEPVKPLNFYQQFARLFMGLFLAASDLLSLPISFLLTYQIIDWLNGVPSTMRTSEILFYSLLVMVLYYLNGLYHAVGLSPIGEIEKLLKSTSLSFLILFTFTYLFQTPFNEARYILVVTWFISIFLVQLFRWVTRIITRRLRIWGEPVVIVGKGPLGRRIQYYLSHNLHLGMKPYLWLSGENELDLVILDSINCSRINTAILVIPEIPEDLQHKFIYEQRYRYHRRKGEGNIQRLIMISSLSWVGSLGIIVHDFEGLMGLEVRQNLLLKGNRALKRLFDLSLSVILGIFAFPLIAIIAAAIKVDSPGGVFYQQKRVGQHGKVFDMWKFRTMYENSELILEEFLRANPDAQKEWQSTRKIKNDPRVTKVGRIIRKLSLDELPQFINILMGEMSLVGPRPYSLSMKAKYGYYYQLYYRVRPGLTGMWQVKGRNLLTIEERAQLDEYYIRNWSIWVDFYILLRTIWVIIKQEGAY